jgi:hypothetical protein
MSAAHTTGLGEPEPLGKKALFQPPEKEIISPKTDRENGGTTQRRIRSTVELTRQAIAVIQEEQSRHRLQTGKVLPIWKVVSRAVELYGKTKTEKSGG